jgi:hypothetical protein
VPAGQLEQEDDPAVAEYVPAGQLVQAEEVEEPVTTEIMPAGQ